MDSANKPLGQKGYGTIPHLPGSRRGPGDNGVNEGQYRICCVKTPPDRKGDEIIVQEKLDGSNCGVAKLAGEIIAINRAGWRASSSSYVHHRLFHEWVCWNVERFDALLQEGERVMGEWLVLAHGTEYHLPHEPFVPFDLIRNGWERALTTQFYERIEALGFTGPRLLHRGGPLPLEEARQRLDQREALADGDDGEPYYGYHRAVDPAEGVVYRIESRGVVDFLAKWVRPEKVDGCYLFECEAGQVKIPPVELPRSAFTWNRWPGRDDPDSPYAAWAWAYQ
jgi:RNA ligase-like protein